MVLIYQIVFFNHFDAGYSNALEKCKGVFIIIFFNISECTKYLYLGPIKNYQLIHVYHFQTTLTEIIL